MKTSSAFLSALAALTFSASSTLAAPLTVDQAVFTPSSLSSLDLTTLSESSVDALLAAYPDPVELYKLLVPEAADELDEPRLLKILGDAESGAFWTTEGYKMVLRRKGIEFADLTGEDEETFLVQAKDDYEWPEITHQKEVFPVFQKLSLESITSHLETLTSFWTRNYKLQSGADSSKWIYNTLLSIIASAPPQTLISLRTFPHSFAQSSIIARFEAPTTNHSSPVVVIGAHQDSLNYRFPLLRAPGADDDGSGTVTIMEAFKALALSGFTPEIPVEFCWFAAEEGGLLGSKDVVKDYLAAEVPVKGMLQMDMTAYSYNTSDQTITIVDSDVTPSLTNFTYTVADAYSSHRVQYATLFPGAGSDHMSFCVKGYPCAFATEGNPMKGEFDPYIHTPADDIKLPTEDETRKGPKGEAFSLTHALEFSKVAIGFAVELGGWVH